MCEYWVYCKQCKQEKPQDQEKNLRRWPIIPSFITTRRIRPSFSNLANEFQVHTTVIRINLWWYKITNSTSFKQHPDVLYRNQLQTAKSKSARPRSENLWPKPTTKLCSTRPILQFSVLRPHYCRLCDYTKKHCIANIANTVTGNFSLMLTVQILATLLTN